VLFRSTISELIAGSFAPTDALVLLVLKAGAVIATLASGAAGGIFIPMIMLGANAGVVPAGAGDRAATFSYFAGKPEEWNADCPAYTRIVYRDLWPGIDLAYLGARDRLEYELLVAPGADPLLARFALRGAGEAAIADSGALLIRTPAAVLEDAAPRAFQEKDGARIEIPMAYTLRNDPASGEAIIGFEVGTYDPTIPIVLDPEMLLYCGYLGGTKVELAKTEGALKTLENMINRLSFSIVLASLIIGLFQNLRLGQAAWLSRVPLSEIALAAAGFAGLWWLFAIIRSGRL